MTDVARGFENHLPRKVVTGRGRSLRIAEEAGRLGLHRLFVASDAGVAGAGLLEQVCEPLAAAGILAGSSTLAASITRPPPSRRWRAWKRSGG